MLVVEPGDSLKHIQTRKILDAIAMQNEKDGSLGSDGETSDYQRSTPSPQDSNARITELSEGLEKAESESPPPLPVTSLGVSVTSSRNGLEWKSNTSPDLGFVDYVDNSSPSPSSPSSPGPLYISQEPEPRRMPYSDTSSNSLGCHSRLSLPSDKVNANSSSNVNHPSTAKILLSKSLKVDLEKLPTVMTSMVTSKHHPSLMFKRSDSSSSTVSCNLKANSRKRYATALSNNQRTGNKKCPRFVSADQRKSSLNKTIPGSKELLLHPNLFNSFRITKPKSNIKCDSSGTANKCNESKSKNNKKSNGVSGIHFETKSFYKFSDSSTTVNSLAVNKQSDLIPPTSVPSSTVFSTKTDSNNDRVSSKLNLLEPKKDSEPLYSNSSEGSHNDLVTGSRDQESGDHQSCHSEAVNPDNAVFALPNPKKIRFPAVPNSSAIQCKWEGCGECFKNHGNLSDHIKTTHVVGVESGDGPKYSCLWVGCKVYGKQSSSLKWLESHVPRHGGKFAYPCIVEGCRMRFSSQAMLERHVNSHFTESSNSSSQTGPRKSIEGATAKKRLKRAGVRLKFRQLPFSARIFDFFDAGIMSGVRHNVSSMQQNSVTKYNMNNDEITFTSKIISIRREGDGSRQVQLKWIPEDLLPDTWVPVDEVTTTKTVKICNLPEKSKLKLHHELLAQPVQRTKQSRKTKRNDNYNPFLTPSEAAQRHLLNSKELLSP